MKNRVRYICVPVTSFELADALSEHDKAVFIEQVLKMFKSCENGDDPVPDKTENRVLEIALEGAAREIKKGYDTYIKRQDARQGNAGKSKTDQRSINDGSAVTGEEKNEELLEKDSLELSEGEGMQGGRPFSELEQQSLNSALNYAGIYPDPQFWTFATKAGYRITMDAIRKTADMRSHSLAYVVKLMGDSMKGAS